MRLSPLTISRPCGRPHSDIIIDAYRRPFAHVAMCVFIILRNASRTARRRACHLWNSGACLIAPRLHWNIEISLAGIINNSLTDVKTWWSDFNLNNWSGFLVVNKEIDFFASSMPQLFLIYTLLCTHPQTKSTLCRRWRNYWLTCNKENQS